MPAYCVNNWAKSDLNYDETVQLAITTLQTVLSAEFKASELEVAVVRSDDEKQGTAFTVLSNEKVEAVLTSIAEKD